MMTTERLSHVVRRQFVDYFANKHGHKFVKSSPVAPTGVDRSVSFVNAGIHQFKQQILADQSSYPDSRVCNYQKCIRVGGKLCDLEQIGRDFRHHTFFEMLGNWSFNDYGKHQACEWALDFLVNQLKLDSERLVMTYFKSQQEEDQQTREIWRSLGIPSDRVRANTTGDNFWEMGAGSGPCGQSTEIFYPVRGGSELLEVWNIVFIDKVRENETSQPVPLKSKFIDTGMGLERVLSIMEDVESNYDTDLFKTMFDVVKAKSPDVPAYGGSLTDELDVNYRILIDHCRMITIALSDGITPGRRGSAYDLRAIIKKSLLISRDVFNQSSPRLLLFDLVDETVNILSPAYPELRNSVKNIRRVLAFESKRYFKQLEKSSDTSKKINSIKHALIIKPHQNTIFTISGRVSNFRVYKSFNFIDLTDGSSKDHLQLILARTLLDKPELGSYLECEGRIVSSRGANQVIEFKADKLLYVSDCDPTEYPLVSAVADTNKNWYRKQIHLRPRVAHFASLLRVRSELELSLHMIMKQMDFFRVHTPSISSNDSEASSDLFLVQRTKYASKALQELSSSDQGVENDSDKDDYNDGADAISEASNHSNRIISDGYFNKDAYLVTSAQLHLESLAASLSKVYTISPCFRAENGISTRHLCEFLMFEVEEANVRAIEPLMDRVETILKFVAQYLCEISEHKADFQHLIEANNNKSIYESFVNSNYIRMHYDEAVKIVGSEHGYDIGRAHELKLLQHTNNVPIFITNFPQHLKPFYMKSSRKAALCFDLIAPIGGEICGGSLREEDDDTLVANLTSKSVDAENTKQQLRNFDWYIDSRRFGSFPHGGFGIGIERVLQSMLGIRNIKDTSAFPRWVGHCPM